MAQVGALVAQATQLVASVLAEVGALVGQVVAPLVELVARMVAAVTTPVIDLLARVTTAVVRVVVDILWHAWTAFTTSRPVVILAELIEDLFTEVIGPVFVAFMDLIGEIVDSTYNISWVLMKALFKSVVLVFDVVGEVVDFLRPLFGGNILRAIRWVVTNTLVRPAELVMEKVVEPVVEYMLEVVEALWRELVWPVLEIKLEVLEWVAKRVEEVAEVVEAVVTDILVPMAYLVVSSPILLASKVR